MNFDYIDSPLALSEFCQKISTASALAIDTEFVRTRTLIPQLGLIQVYDGEHLGLIDPVAIDDISEFSAILINPSIIKVLHSCSEDLEAFWYNLGLTPTPVFDTQFAANLLDMGQTIGYANLVENLLSVHVDKGESRTDWMARPLSTQQLKYAAADVYYLLPVYELIAKQIAQREQTEWVYQEIEFLAAKKRSLVPTKNAYLSVKNNWKLHGHSLKALQIIAQWRVQQARDRDMAINFVLREQAMVEVAMRLPDSKVKVCQLNALTPKEARIHAQVLADMVQQAKQTDLSDCPAKVQRLTDFPQYKKALASLKLLTDDLARQYNTRAEVLASKKQMNQWLTWCWFDIDELAELELKPDLVSAWRHDIFAEPLKLMFAGGQGEFHALRRL